MKHYLIQSCIFAALLGLGATGCSNLFRNQTTSTPQSVARVPGQAAEDSSGGGGNANGPIAPQGKIALIRFEEAPGGNELPPPGMLKEAVAKETPGHFQTQPSKDIDLATALALVSGQNPRVAFAQEQIAEAFAVLQAANVLWLPSINAGVNYNKHEGRLQDVEGEVRDISRGALGAGLGAGAVGAGSPSRPGLYANFRLADAIFQPRIADSKAAAQQAAFTATLNDTLLDTALAYLDLLEAYQQEAIARETLDHSKKLADLTRKFAQTGQGSQADADRAHTELTFRQNNVSRAGENVAVASARTVELLNLDQTVSLRPVEPTVFPINLVGVESPLPDLVASGLSNRPELAESRFLVTAAVQALQREKCSPFIPNVQVGVSEMGFGGAPNSNISHFGDRFDFDAILYWELRNLGCGEIAARKLGGAKASQAKFREIQVMNRVAREVAEANAQVQARGQQIAIAQEGIKAAQGSYKLNLARIQGGQGLPLEVLQSIQALDQARKEYLRTVVDYNRAQFRLYRAMGWPVNS